MSSSPPPKRQRAEGSDPLQSPCIPIVDIGALHGTDEAAKVEVARTIGNACLDSGFFVVVNHGIPDACIEEVVRQSLAFFALPTAEKQKQASEDQAKYPYGYLAFGEEGLSQGKLAETGSSAKTPTPGDFKELFSIGPDWGARCGMEPRRLPSNPAGFDRAWAEYYDAANALALKLLRAFELALDLPEGWFADKVDRHMSSLRANHYPSLSGVVVPPGAMRASAHTDYGTVTILRASGPGLQVSKDVESPTWHDVPFVEDSFIINLGDLMKRWTNNMWSSTLHRVIVPPPEKVAESGSRLSLAFFHNLNKDVVVEAIPGCVSSSRPRLYDPIVAGEFLMLKHLASTGKSDKDAHLKVRSDLAQP